VLLRRIFLFMPNWHPVPEIKAVSRIVKSASIFLIIPPQIIGGYVFDSFLSSWTLLIKALGLALSVSSGLSLGKEVNIASPKHIVI
jgi:H+/Cl- antiporter ClcA